MRQVYKYDSEGKYIEPIMIEDNEQIPTSCTDRELPQPNWKPVFLNGEWIETITEGELNALINKPPELSPLEQNQKDLADLTFQLMMGGVI